MDCLLLRCNTSQLEVGASFQVTVRLNITESVFKVQQVMRMLLNELPGLCEYISKYAKVK